MTTAEISSLFIIWSVTAFAIEVPSGVWADRFSRRRLLILAPLITGAGYTLWTFAPSYASFAAGFVLWGIGSALASGTRQALVYEELSRIGAADSYARLIGRARAVGTTAMMVATAGAAPLLAVGDYPAVGAASIAATLLGAAVAWTFPESRGSADEEDEGFVAVLRNGVAEVRRTPRVRGALVVSCVVMGATALDEYLPFLARSTGVHTSTVPLLLLLVTAAMAVGGWLAGRGTRWLAPFLAVAAACLVVGGLVGHPVGMVAIAVAFGILEWAMVATDTRLQDSITDRARATITSLAGFGSEVIAVFTFAAYAVGSTWSGPGPLFALAAVPYLLTAVALRRPRPARGPP